MKVYVVEMGASYDSSGPVGVYASCELAMAAYPKRRWEKDKSISGNAWYTDDGWRAGEPLGIIEFDLMEG